jgi:hypothetical protein
LSSDQARTAVGPQGSATIGNDVRKPKAIGPEVVAWKSSTDAFASLRGFSYPDVHFQAIKWVIINDLWY